MAVKAAKNTNLNRSRPSTSSKVIPIIQTRRMKLHVAESAAKDNSDLAEFNTQKELQELNRIDKLSSFEISGGDRVFDEDSPDEAEADGVELSVNGSDDEFQEESNLEPGKVSDEEQPQISRPQVASKVVKVPKANRSSKQSDKQGSCSENRSDHFSKFSHLKDDPDFRYFLDEVLDDRENLEATHRIIKVNEAAKINMIRYGIL